MMATKPRGSVLRVEQELRQFLRDPVPGIHVWCSEEDIMDISALIVGPDGTPYAGGFFHFSIRILPEYPFKPPAVLLRTTDKGRVRFNPNLYACGKVCLSILGTWTGPEWSSACSLSSVLLSIQSLMSPKPFHNEPGFENRKDPVAIQNYNEMIAHEVMRVAVCGVLDDLQNSRFKDVIERHFLMYYDKYRSTIQESTCKDGQSFNDPFKEGHGRFNHAALLSRLEKSWQTISEDVEASYGNETLTSLKDQGSLDAVSAIQREYDQCSEEPGASASVRKENPFVWDIAVFGPETSPWEGGVFQAEVSFSVHFPERPPFVRYKSPMFHPNISPDGIPYLETVQVRWNVSSKMKNVLHEMSKLLSEPRHEHSLNPEALCMFVNEKRKYDREVRRVAQLC